MSMLPRIILFVSLLLCSASPVMADTPRSILVLGDSLTAGYGLSQTDAFPAVLEARLTNMGKSVSVRNGGISGDTTAGGRARLDWALSPKPDAVILELGANDALRGQSPENAYNNLKAMILALKAKDIPVLLTGMKAPRNYGPEYAAAFDAIYPRLATETGVALYPFFMEGVITHPDLLQADGLHPQPDGVKIIVENILPHVVTLLEQIEAAK